MVFIISLSVRCIQSLHFSFFALSNEEPQTHCWSFERNFGSLGKVQDVSGNRMNLITAFVADVKFTFDDNFHLIISVRVHERRAL
jgi:hypothetical protein